MRSPRSTRVLGLAGLALSLPAFAGCGSRTGLLVFDGAEGESASTTSASASASTAGSRSSTSSAEGCADAGSTLIYVVTEQSSLYSFDPSQNVFARVGTLRCAAQAAAEPFSMAVSRNGTAYIVYDDGELFLASTANAACESPTVKLQTPGGFPATFGMAFVSNTPNPGDTLYVAGDNVNDPQENLLASIDTTTFRITPLGPAPLQAELTGTSAGQLFAFFSTPNDASTTQIAALDKTTGAVGAPEWTLPLALGSGWAFAAWGGAFYTFTGTGTTTVVRRFDPATQTTIVAGSLGELVVGAGVSTCAPGP